MEIRIRDSGEFHRLLAALAEELVSAQNHFKLYNDLTANMPEYAVEFRQS